MKNKKNGKKLCVAVMVGISVLMSPVTSVYAEEGIVPVNLSSTETGIETRTPKIDWVYKVINGHVYKRLYNYSTGRWESDWILVQ